jgi:hypothetical protein
VSAAKWVRTYESDTGYLESLGGVLWNDARLPYLRHRCSAQTRGWFGLNYTERCACGAVRFSHQGPWAERNQTRKARRRQRREDRLPRVRVTCRECGGSYEAADGTPRARARQCDTCWGAALTAGLGE